MKTWRYGMAVALLTGLGACSNMMGNTSSRQAALVQPTVAPGMVKQVQSKLRDDGYYKQGSVDGVWGSGTESAVRSFQKDHNLDSSGQLDVPTIQALNLTSGSGQSTDTGADHSGVDTTTSAAPVNHPADGTGTSPTH